MTGKFTFDQTAGPSRRPPSANRGVVVITGGSAGVGRATARTFAAAGHDVGLIARGGDRLEEARAEIQALGRRCHVVLVDVAAPAALDDAAGEIEAALGPIEIWVNAAMTSIIGRIEALTAGEFRRVTDVTYHGAVYGTMAALRRMRDRDRGTIVQVGSGLAYRAIPLQSAYCGAKFAIRGFTDSVRSELIHEGSGIRLSMVQLPATNTPQFSWVRNRLGRRIRPLPPVFQPEVAARAILWAAEHAPRELNVGWPTTLAILGQAIAPVLMDRYVARFAWSGQLSETPEDATRADNLWAPSPVDVSAHGRFDDTAHPVATQQLLATHPLVVRAVAGLAAIIGLGWVARRLTN